LATRVIQGLSPACRTKEAADRLGTIIKDMPVVVEMHNTGDSGAGSEIIAMVEHVLSDKPGDWRVSIVGSRENDSWEMKIEGPKGFERSYTLTGGAGEHQPAAIRDLILKLLPSST